MYRALRPALFALDPETAHDLTLSSVGALGRVMGPGQVPEVRPIEKMGLRFANPVGLAAGLDKDATAFDGLARFGFGFIEVGTVTPLAQPGNPKPRMFRLPESDAIINRMGFNNHGLDALVQRVKSRRYSGVLGINLGKNKDTSAADASSDYVKGLEAVHKVADYVTVNLSSPNTPGLRDLQLGAALDELMSSLGNARDRLADRDGLRTPLLVKLAPDLADDDLDAMADQLVAGGVDGIIATNTTIVRDAVAGQTHADEAGGLSGHPVYRRALEVTRRLRSRVGPDVTLVGVGGIDSPERAAERLAAGADLIQVYTGLIYQGPGLVKRCLRAL